MYIQKYYKVIRVIKDGDGGATPLYIENVSDSDGVFKLNKSGSPTTPNLIYRIGDNGEWFEYDVTTLPSITVPSGSKIYFRGDNVNRLNQDNYNYYYFTFSKSYNIGGYITSLLTLDNFNTITDVPNYSFCYLFNQQKTLLNAKDVITDNIINVGNYGFFSCFNGCTSLTTAPSFDNVTTVGEDGFYWCFKNCTSLTTSPDFRNVTTVGKDGFVSCFDSCTSLTTAPSFNNVTTVGGSGFYGTFNRCTSLTTVPSFDKITTANGSSFWVCFNGCTSLVTPPTFENLTTINRNAFLYCFKDCTSLTTSPDFRNVTTVGDEGFNQTFPNCTSLQVVYAPNITTWNTNKFPYWLQNVSPTGIIYKPTGLEIPTGTSGVPDGWTTANY